MDNHLVPKTVKGWDSFLIKEYGFGIWNFSYCLADMIIIKEGKYRYHPQTELPRILLSNRNEYLREEIKIRENLKTHIIEILDNSLRGIGIEKDKETQLNFIIDVYNLKPFFKHLNNEIEGFKSSMRKRGRTPETRYQIASIWSQIVKGKRGTNWACIEYLLGWFFKKLFKTSYCKILGNEYVDFYRSGLRDRYYVKKRDKKNRKNIEIFRERFFPAKRPLPLLRIEFKNDYINLSPANKKGPLIIFPDGETFQ